MAVELKTEACKALVAQMTEVKDMWTYFMWCLEIPRGSTNMAGITKALVEFGKGLGLETTVDQGGNVIIRKPASPGCEGKPTVCIQSHMDIVCEKNDDVEHDFLKDPIKPRIDGDYVKATGTSLGADDGAGIAVAMAVLASKTMKHGPVECLFTADEEIGLLGAARLEPGNLKAKYLINVDSEEENSICIGCAGGFVANFRVPIVRGTVGGDKQLRFRLGGMLGGHTGVDIEKNRANSVKLMARLMAAASEYEPRLVDIVGGTAHNAVPREGSFEVCVAADKADAFVKCVEEEFAAIVKEFKSVEPGLAMSATEPLAKFAPCDVATTQNIVNFMQLMPFQVLRMSPDVPKLVETSFATTVVEMKDEHCFVMGSGRSSSKSQIKYLQEQLTALARLAGMDGFEVENPYPGWEPILDSPLLKAAEAVHIEEIGVKPDVYAIHAGLECGLIQDIYPDLLCISVGPELHNPHSPDEELLIRSVPNFYRFVVKTLERLAE